MFSSKPFLAVFFLSCVLWAGSILIAGNPLARIDRACAPIGWTNTLFTALTRLVAPSYAPKVDAFFVGRFSDCRYLVWQQFYESGYQEMAQQKAAEGSAE